MFKLNFKLFFKNVIFLMITAVAGAFSLLFLLYQLFSILKIDGYFEGMFYEPLRIIQMLSWFCIVFFLFIGYEYFIQSKKHFVTETLDGTVKGSKTSYKYQFLVMETMIAVVFLVALTYVYVFVAALGGLNLPYAVHIFIDVFLNIFLLSNVGLFIGMAMTKNKKRLSAYIVMFLFAVVTGPFGEEIYKMITNYTGINLYKVANLFFVCAPNTEYVVDYSFVSSVLPYRFFAVFIWIFFALMIFLLPMSFEKKKKAKPRIVTATLILLVIACGFGVLMPQSKVIRNSDPNEFNFAEDTYYQNQYTDGEIVFPDTKEQPFNVSSYDMTLSALFDLSASVTMTVDKSNLDNYCFTLYHGYKVKSVEDQSGNSMDFVQDKDFIVVKNNGKTVEKITMKYSGSSPSRYSNVQGLNLPGDFAYYPHSGFKKLYNMKGLSTLSDVVSDNTEFEIDFKYGKKIFSNLESVGKNKFYGKSNGVTLVSGFYEEMKVGDTIFVIPYLNGYYSDKEYMKKSLNGFEKLSASIEDMKEEFPYYYLKYSMKDKKIILLPLNNENINSVLFQDHIASSNALYGFSIMIREKITGEAIENVES